MGLITRLRRTWDAGAEPSDDDAAQMDDADPSPSPLPLIRAEDLDRGPEWAQVPRPDPLLPPVPFVVSRSFDEDLVSWRPPELFLDSLSHSVSVEAPSGLIEAIGVLAPPLVEVG